MLKGVLVNGQWTTEPNRVKEEIRLFFKRFQDSEENRPRLDRVRFQAIGQYHNEILVEHFHEKESNDAMWECESEKSPGPDGLTFKFIKEFRCIVFLLLMKWLRKQIDVTSPAWCSKSTMRRRTTQYHGKF